MSEKQLTPAYDNKIYQKYSKKTIQNKAKNKIAFCQDNELPYNKSVPLICITYPLTDKNNIQMMMDVMRGILEQPVQLIITGIGTQKYQRFFTELAEKHPEQIAITENNEEVIRRAYAAADMIFIADTNRDCVQEAKNTMAYGVVPIMPAQSFAKDYDAIQEKGNAFIYQKGSAWGFFAAFIRALENFKFPYDWKSIAMNAMK